MCAKAAYFHTIPFNPLPIWRPLVSHLRRKPLHPSNLQQDKHNIHKTCCLHHVVFTGSWCKQSCTMTSYQMALWMIFLQRQPLYKAWWRGPSDVPIDQTVEGGRATLFFFGLVVCLTICPQTLNWSLLNFYTLHWRYNRQMPRGMFRKHILLFPAL